MTFATVILASFAVSISTLNSDNVSPAVEIASDAIQPQVAIDGDGNIYVAMLHQGNIAVAVSTDRGRSFSDPVVAIDVKGRMKGGRQRGPRIGVDAKKNIIVTAPAVFDEAEFKKKYPTADLYFVTSRDGGKSWTKPVRLNEEAKKAPESLHWLAVTPTGEAHVAWLDLRARQGPGQDIFFAKVVNGAVTKNSPIATNVCECCAPGLAVDSSGNPVVAFREGGKEKASREIFAIRSTNKGTSFSRPVQLNKDPSLEDG